MDNDLMARRLRPPSQPNPGNGQSQPNQGDAAQVPSPWDVALTPDGQFAPPQPQHPNQDPPFAPQWAAPDRQPNPAEREDVPWDRPAAEPWPPTDDTWSAQGGVPNATPDRPDWPTADALDEPAPWDRPAANSNQWQDPDDAYAPVVGGVQMAAPAWNGNGNSHANGNGYANGGNGTNYATPGTPEPMTVAAHSDQPPAGDEPRTSDESRSGGTHSTPEWPAEDDLTLTPPMGRGPIMPEDSWPAQPAWPPVEPAAPPAATDWTEPAAVAAQPTPPAELEPEPESDPEPAAPAAQPIAPAGPRLELTTPPNTQVVAVTPGGTPQNMVLRIELAIVDESHRANPADSAKRVGPDADVRRPEYEPRNSGGGAPMPEPEYIWGAPPEPRTQQDPQRRPRQGRPAQPAQPSYPPQSAQHLAPPPSAWLPAPQPAQPQRSQPQNLDWDLPQVAPGQAPGQVPGQPMTDPPAPWSTPATPQAPEQAPYAPAPTWAMTQPTPAYQPEPPQYMPPPTPQYPQPPAAQYPPAAPQYQQPLTGQYPQATWPAAPQPFDQPTRPQHMPQPVQSVPVAAPAAGSRARTGGVAADQADLWFLNNQPAAATVVDEDSHTLGRSSSLVTVVLTVLFAVLVIVLVLVFIQLMTSLLR